MIKLKIKVTKEILEKSKMCGLLAEDGNTWKHSDALNSNLSQNCAISIACQEIFPQCDVGIAEIVNDARFNNGIDSSKWEIELPTKASNFIGVFDKSTLEERVNLEPFEFEVELNDDVLNCIDISNLDLSKSKTLELV